MRKVYIQTGTTKGDLINIACNYEYAKIRNIDPALPLSWLKENPEKNTFFYVMDYNINAIFGEIKHLADVAKDNKIQLIFLNHEPDETRTA